MAHNGDGDPSWANPAAVEPTEGEASAGNQPATGGKSKAAAITADKKKDDDDGSLLKARIFLSFLSLFNMALAAAMGALGVISCMNTATSTIDMDDLSDMFAGIYMVLFACILFLYEFCWWQPFPAVNRAYRKNFGFMYGLNSKGCFLIVTAFLSLGFDDDNNSGFDGLFLVTGIAWLVAGLVHIGVALCWPETVQVYRPPAAGLVKDDHDDENANDVEATSVGD